ncbi:UNVERIFIED_CONTAM: REF/SRPP-like protein [Sesamum radiatum]|uniref:REF/SRPP-like protein n=1 Tax=Sesamum radiatum TaxID=300843 RepID=A0AAW2U7U9_SESRA
MALHALMCAAKLYSYAKENSGPLKPGVDTVEGTVKTVVGPVYDKYHDFPIEVLKFIDRKVDESVNKVQSRVPPTLKEVSTQAFETAQKAPAAARSVVTEVKNTGVVGTASGLAKTVYAKYEPAAKDLYIKYEPVAEQYVALAWRQLNQLPLFPGWLRPLVQQPAIAQRCTTKKFNRLLRKGTRLQHIFLWYPPKGLLGCLAHRSQACGCFRGTIAAKSCELWGSDLLFRLSFHAVFYHTGQCFCIERFTISS